MRGIEELEAKDQAVSRANILLVDDQPSNLLALEAVLKTLDVNVIKARSGVEALRSLLSEDFALILMDVKMPAMDGFETAALIRQRRRSQHTPIIFLTAYESDDRQMFKGYSLGAVDYIHKPIVPEVLRSKAAVFVDIFQKTGRAARAPPSASRGQGTLGSRTPARGDSHRAADSTKALPRCPSSSGWF